MQDEPDPPRKFYTLKSKEIERLNAPAGQHSKSDAIDVKDHLKNAAITSRTRAAPAAPAPNDVQQLVQTNAEKEHSAGINDVGLDRPPAPSRRKRDYITTLILGNGAIIGLTAAVGLNPVTSLFCLGGVIIFNTSVTWIIWFVMDRY